jgi:hypothetical protein
LLWKSIFLTTRVVSVNFDAEGFISSESARCLDAAGCIKQEQRRFDYTFQKPGRKSRLTTSNGSFEFHTAIQRRSCAKGSRKNKFPILGVEAPGRQGAKTQEYLDIQSFRNTVGRDASASKM